MSEITDRLVDNIIEIILEDMDCQHEVDHGEDGSHTSVEYNLQYELKVRGKIMALLKPKVTEEWIEEKAKQINAVMVKLRHVLYAEKMKQLKDFTRLFIEEIVEK